MEYVNKKNIENFEMLHGKHYKKVNNWKIKIFDFDLNSNYGLKLVKDFFHF